MRRRSLYLLIFILVLFGLAIWSITPISTNLLGPDGLRLGLDLRGGSQLLYQADLSMRDPGVSESEAMASVLSKIQRRVDQYGAAEPVIQKLGTDRILVQLPGVDDIYEAISLIGETALLDFREQIFDAGGNPVLDDRGNPVFKEESARAEGRDGQERDLTGRYLKRAYIDFAPLTGAVVVIEWDSEGGYLFEAITRRNLNKLLAIFLDDEIISAPVVRSVITAGTAGVIEGDFTISAAEVLAIQLNSGALDLPLTIIDQRDVDASLGADSLRQSRLAATIGVILLLLFMLLYYRLTGLVACCGLAIYGVFLVAIFNLFSSYITLTLPGIAAALLSLGMAVDANILIFERIKEEIRAGRSLAAAVEAGFNRAWTAIRDSNITTFIACIVLFWLGGTFGAMIVRGFALTLFIGVALSMFTAIIVTRTFLRLVVGGRLVTSPAAFGVKK